MVIETGNRSAVLKKKDLKLAFKCLRKKLKILQKRGCIKREIRDELFMVLASLWLCFRIKLGTAQTMNIDSDEELECVYSAERSLRIHLDKLLEKSGLKTEEFLEKEFINIWSFENGK